MQKSTGTPVIFRKERNGDVVAVFPATPATPDPATFTVFDTTSGHGSAVYAWYHHETKPVTPDEYADVKRTLEINYDYDDLVVCEGWERRFDKERRAALAQLWRNA